MAEDFEFVIKENGLGVNIIGKNGGEYMEKATFSIELLKYIEAGDDSGFVCKVYCALRERCK